MLVTASLKLPKMPDKRVEDGHLALHEPRPGLSLRGPFGAVDLRKAADGPGPFWPLERKSVAHDLLGLKVRFGGEDRNDLAGGLPEVAQSAVVGAGCRSADLLRELTVRGHQRVLAGNVFPLGDRPGARLLTGPERSAHVGDPHLQRGCGPGRGGAALPVQQNPCAPNAQGSSPGLVWRLCPDGGTALAVDLPRAARRPAGSV